MYEGVFERCRNFLIALGIAIGITICAIGFGIYKYVHKSDYIKKIELIKDVNMKEVSVGEEASFKAEIEIIYKNGKLDSVILVPGSTTKK